MFYSMLHSILNNMLHSMQALVGPLSYKPRQPQSHRLFSAYIILTAAAFIEHGASVIILDNEQLHFICTRGFSPSNGAQMARLRAFDLNVALCTLQAAFNQCHICASRFQKITVNLFSNGINSYKLYMLKNMKRIL